jgi:hypothetical protein
MPRKARQNTPRSKPESAAPVAQAKPRRLIIRGLPSHGDRWIAIAVRFAELSRDITSAVANQHETANTEAMELVGMEDMHEIFWKIWSHVGTEVWLANVPQR